MTLQTWWLYCCAVFLISATPGPNMLHVMTRSVAYGARAATASMAGCMSAILIALSASAAGLSAVLAASPALFNAIKYAGVAYLIWLGIQSWRAKVDVGAVEGEAPKARTASPARLYRDGFLIAISNPKLLVFAAALFPQFIDNHAPRMPQFAILVVSFVVIETFWYAVYALSGAKLAHWLTHEGRQRMFNRVTGALFVGFGAALFGYRV